MFTKPVVGRCGPRPPESLDLQAAELVELRISQVFPSRKRPNYWDSPRTADRVWAYARAWLHREIAGPENHRQEKIQISWRELRRKDALDRTSLPPETTKCFTKRRFVRGPRDEERARTISFCLEIKDPERKAYLQSACAGDSGLLARVESLLASHENHSEFLATPAMEQLGGSFWPGEPPPRTSSARLDRRRRLRCCCRFSRTESLTPREDTRRTRPRWLFAAVHPPRLLRASGSLRNSRGLGKGPLARCSKRSTTSYSGWWQSNHGAELAAASPARKRFLREA